MFLWGSEEEGVVEKRLFLFLVSYNRDTPAVQPFYSTYNYTDARLRLESNSKYHSL
jgi:hypothetical protein